MRIFYELRYAVIIEIVWTFSLKSVLAKFQKYLKHMSWVISGTSSSKLPWNPLHPPPGTSVVTIVIICCNHRNGEYVLHRITRKLWSTATSTVITRLLPLTNYISDAENETRRALLGHTNGNIEMRSPSAAAMLTMVAAATIVRSPQWSYIHTNTHTHDNDPISNRNLFLHYWCDLYHRSFQIWYKCRG